MNLLTAKQASLPERLASHGLVALAGGIILWDTGSYSGASAYFPRTVGGALVALSAISSVVAFRKPAKDGSEAPLNRGIPGLILLFAYIWISQYVGFLTSTIWFVPALALLGGERRWAYFAILTAGFAAALFLVFVMLFKQPLPPELIFGEI